MNKSCIFAAKFRIVIMSLETVIKTGKLYRTVGESWKYHDQVNRVKNDVDALSKNKDRDGNAITTIFYELSVVEQQGGFVFDFANLHELTDEDKREQLYYLNFKTSKKDTEKRYLLGDIAYSCYTNKKGELIENGNYRMAKDKKKSSFFRCEEVAKTIENAFVQMFRDEFRKNADKIEQLLQSSQSVVLHFNFNGKRWIDVDGIIDSIDENLTRELVSEDNVTGRVILEKYLYKTLGGVTPGFRENTKYKNKLFTRDDIVSLMYAGTATEKPLIRINSVGIIALPHSDKLSAIDVVNFFERDKNNFSEEIVKEETIVTESQRTTDSDSLFTDLIENDFDDSVKFDIVFTSIPASKAGVFHDLVEIANVEKSLLKEVHENIQSEKRKLLKQIEKEFPNAKKEFGFEVKYSFLKILGDVTKDKKKYQFHLLKVLPQIYSDTYYEDPILFPVFIDKVEYNIRNDGQSFGTLKYDFYLLMNLQKNKPLMNIVESKSYAIGQFLGIMARPFAAWRDDCPIKSFEKSYVGNLSRRISSLGEVTKFAAFMNEKLIMHEKAYKSVQNAHLRIVETIAHFEKERTEKYNKNNCALGFFEAYYQNSQSENTSNENNTNN